MEEDPHDMEWPYHDAVATKSGLHLTQGDWAIDTINPDGWRKFFDYLILTTADFVVGQERKVPTDDECRSLEAAARTAGWHSITKCVRTKAEGNSAGVVVATRMHGRCRPGRTHQSHP